MDLVELSASGQTISPIASQEPRQAPLLCQASEVTTVSAAPSVFSVPAPPRNVSSSLRLRTLSPPPLQRSDSLAPSALLRQLAQCPLDDDYSSVDLDEDEDEDEDDDSDRHGCPSCDGFDDPAAVLDADDADMGDDSDLEVKSTSVSSMSVGSTLSNSVRGLSPMDPPTVPMNRGPLLDRSVAPCASGGTILPAPTPESVCLSALTLRTHGLLSPSLETLTTSSNILPGTALPPITCGDLATLLSRRSINRGFGSGNIASGASECISVHERLCELLATAEPRSKVVFKEAM